VSDLEALIAVDGLSREDLLNVYVIGSRAHGTAHAGSDHDIVAVMRPHRRRWRGMQWLVRDGWAAPDARRYRGARRDFIGRDDRQIWVFDAPTFIKMRDAHVLLALECLWLPAEQVWLRREELGAGFVVDRGALAPAITYVAERHWDKGRRALSELADGEDPTAGRKFLVHAMRALMFGAQLAGRGRIVDYGAANGLRRELLAAPACAWEALARRFEPTFAGLAEAFTRACASG
jgi:hypothetical protein